MNAVINYSVREIKLIASRGRGEPPEKAVTEVLAQVLGFFSGQFLTEH